MTREEIIKGLNAVNKECGERFDESFAWMAEIFQEAIKALEQQPCEDAISRQAALDIVRFEDKWLVDAKAHNAESCIAFNGLLSKIRELHPVTCLEKPNRWIPVSERFPEDGEDVLMYIERNAWDDDGLFRKKCIDIGWQVEGMWHCDGCSGVVGIAWMPLPEPFKESEE